jgi:hypothetical protein
LKTLILLSTIIFQLSASASALLVKDEANKTLTVRSHFYFYGLIDETLSKNVAQEINDVWNAHHHQIILNKVSYKLLFKITASVVDIDEARDISYLSNPINNFVRIIEKANTSITSSFMVGHTNSGVWLLSGQLGVNKTAAHEYGHSLGLDHPEGDHYEGIPRIMLTQFYGRNLNLKDREVLKVDIAELKIKSDSNTLGEFTNTFFFDEDGNVLAY